MSSFLIFDNSMRTRDHFRAMMPWDTTPARGDADHRKGEGNKKAHRGAYTVGSLGCRICKRCVDCCPAIANSQSCPTWRGENNVNARRCK